MHSYTLTSCLQLTLNVLNRLFIVSYVKHSTDVRLTMSRLFSFFGHLFVLTYHFLSVHTIWLNRTLNCPVWENVWKSVKEGKHPVVFKQKSDTI